MITVQETTVWDHPYDNHKYILSDDRRWMYGFIRKGETYPKLFNRPIGFEARGRTFEVLHRTKDIDPGTSTWNVEGSKGNVYTVTKRGDQWTCTCPQGMFRGRICKHIEKIQNQ